MKVYIAGPMTGYPGHNIGSFDRMAHDLRQIVDGAGPGHLYDVVNPAEVDGPEIRAFYLADQTGLAEMPGTSWGDFLARDLSLIVNDGIEAIVVLPGWEKSRGARLETFAGHIAGLKIVRPEYSWTGKLSSLWQIPRSELLRAWEGDDAPRPL